MNNNFIKCAAAALYFGLTTLTSHAQLAFLFDVKEYHPDLFTREIKVEFPFVNIGKTPITIKAITPSCGCTVAESDKRVYNPGDKGVINATYTIHGTTGYQEKQIAITTVENPDSLKILVIKAYIPSLITFTPNDLKWTEGEAAASKSVEFDLISDKAAKVLGRVFKIKKIEV